MKEAEVSSKIDIVGGSLGITYWRRRRRRRKGKRRRERERERKREGGI
jgi:hypothetical protein